MTEDFTWSTERPTYYPAFLEDHQESRRVRPVSWFRAPDLRGVSRANAFVIFPPGNHQHRAGQMFPVLPMEW